MDKVKPLLSILIPSTPDRVGELSQLLIKLEELCLGIKDIWELKEKGEQIFTHYFHNGVEATVFIDDKVLTIGEKREFLYEMANGVYSWQIDSDDSIAPNAIEKILEAIQSGPDCVTFRERCDMNGTIKSSNHALKYEKWQDNFDGFDYVRSPFYKDVIKTEIAQSVPFPHIRWNEDEQWSMALRPHLKTEVHIDEELYYYSYYPKETHEERYGYDKQ